MPRRQRSPRSALPAFTHAIGCQPASSITQFLLSSGCALCHLNHDAHEWMTACVYIFGYVHISTSNGRLGHRGRELYR